MSKHRIDEREIIEIDDYSMEIDDYKDEHLIDTSMGSGWFETKQDNSEGIDIIGLSLPKHWDSLDSAIAYVKNYANEQDSASNRKNLDPLNQHDKQSKRKGCPWKVNIRNSKTQGIHITKIENIHNHQITQNEIEHYTN
ncbi:15194_t:CDS:2 [Entrophospora sp. SA101]|nr:5678_t:CDS:2 [Entrophospora sp. SA101]CAJ0648822.1 15194_t:CDS:2 [Entrophospora sp. SA101]CAJ0839418.1 12488_t:CDS:2 [Entrophospora sp. SA101]CAJ0906241.1 1992_t:CDS:2 [Entrophospora sp. SA101]